MRMTGRVPQPGSYTVQHGVEPEVEALIPGLRVVGIEARFHQAQDLREAAGLPEPVADPLMLGLELLRRHVRLRQFLRLLTADLLGLPHHRAHDVDHQRHEELDVEQEVRAYLIEQGEHPLEVADVVRPARRTAADDVHQPLMLEQPRALPVRERPEVRPPAYAWLRYLNLGFEGIAYRLEQFFLRADMPVQGHRASPQLAGEPAHADRLEALGIGQGDRRPDDLVPGQPLATTWRPRPAILVALHVPGDPPLASLGPGYPSRPRVGARRPRERPLLLVVFVHDCSFCRQACQNGLPLEQRTAIVHRTKPYTVLVRYIVRQLRI